MDSYDFIVIGSGFGGSVSAHRLNTAGAKVALIERGPWRDAAPNKCVVGVPKSPLPYGKYFYSHLLNKLSLPFFKNSLTLNSRGLYEFFYQKDMSVLCASGVGGGSHVYSAMNVRPAVSNYWESILGAESASEMEGYYQWMIHQMGAANPDATCPNYVGNQWSDSTQFHAHEIQPDMSVSHQEGDIGNNSFLGSPTGTKATLDKVLLHDAQSKGLSIYALHECYGIFRHRTQNNHFFLVKCFDHNEGRYRFLKATKVILAAGTLNSVRLLFKSRDVGGLQGMPALGLGFAGNGDFPAYWALDRKNANFMKSAPCHGRLALRDNEGVPNITTYGLNGFDNVPLPRRIKNRLKQDLILVGMGADTSQGVITWKKGRLGIRYLPENQAILNRIASTFDQIATLSGKKVFYTRQRYITVHPLGGAIAGSDKHQSVVNLKGEVHDNPGLFISDASALPAAPGSPPSMTIAAWSSHVSQQLIKTA